MIFDAAVLRTEQPLPTAAGAAGKDYRPIAATMQPLAERTPARRRACERATERSEALSPEKSGTRRMEF